MSFIYTFYFFINLDKILRPTKSGGAIAPLAALAMPLPVYTFEWVQQQDTQRSRQKLQKQIPPTVLMPEQEIQNFPKI